MNNFDFTDNSNIGKEYNGFILLKIDDIPKEKWIAAIENTVNPKFVEMNKKAFELGFNS